MPAVGLRPAIPAPPLRQLSLWRFLQAVRTNALTIWPEAAYREPMTSRLLFGRPHVLLNDPVAIHHVLVANPQNYRRSRASVRILRPITGRGLLLSEGEHWKVQRRTVAPALAPRVMPMLARHIAEVLAMVQTRFDRLAGQPIDLLAEMQALALEIAGRSMFSLQMERHGPAIRDLLAAFASRHARPGFLDLTLPAAMPTPGDLGRRLFRRRWMALIATILRDRLDTPLPDPPADLLDLLRSARDPETGRAFDPENLADQVVTLLLAGHETTAVTLFWALLLLAQAPAEAAMIAQEAAGLTLTPDTAFDDTARLVRTRAVVHEALRLFPPAFTIVREAIGADRIGGLTLPPRSVVMIAPWVLHRHEALWADPDLFQPARFLPDQSSPPRFAFLPFGAGPRVCVGAQFAMTEAVLVLATLLRRYRLDVVDGHDVGPVGIVTTQPDRRVSVVLTR